MFKNLLANSESWIGKLKWIALAVLVVLFVIIVFRNLEETNVELIFGTVTLPLAALLSVTLLIGFVLGISASALWKVRHWRAKSRADKKGDAQAGANNS